METGTININGVDYYANYAVRVELTLEAHGMHTTDLKDAPTTTLVLRMLEAMLDSGYRWAKREGIDAPAPPDFDALADSLEYADIGRYMAEISRIITGHKRQVEAEPAKKEEAAQ